jgi:hypothetical protein
MHSKLETLRHISIGQLTIEDAAARHGVAPETIVEWSEFFLAGAQAKRFPRALVTMVALFGALGLAGAARAACNNPVYGNLIGVCPDAPAVASDYNANLQRIDTRLVTGVATATQLRTDLNTTITNAGNKIGALGTTGVTLQSPISFGGNCTASEVPYINSSGAVDCRPLYANSGTPIITAFETGDIGNGSTGNFQQDIASTANTVCFLSDARFGDLDDGSEEGRCLVERQGTNWRVFALSNGDSHAVCRARCIQFNF